MCPALGVKRSIPEACKEINEQANNVHELGQVGQPDRHGPVDEGHVGLGRRQGHDKELLQKLHQAQQPSIPQQEAGQHAN